ncbi:hypothetical protein RRG08_063411 [Elysia crispata]|uniref:Uncharacterized protein n=1 Tax=Elysia crispata TaxID=231223 RepID=A0AAE1DUT6_9GAST|nr:hypothetical protein RRG08_063411 [Elysia crispata]
MTIRGLCFQQRDFGDFPFRFFVVLSWSDWSKTAGRTELHGKTLHATLGRRDNSLHLPRVTGVKQLVVQNFMSDWSKTAGRTELHGKTLHATLGRRDNSLHLPRVTGVKQLVVQNFMVKHCTQLWVGVTTLFTSLE